jgi:DNA-binding winged helix-turn-helix (wHTH) protein
MRCRVLGPVELAVGDRPVPPASRHQRTILAVLLAAPGMAASTDRLIDALWPDAAPSGARKALQMHVTRLRRLLAREAGSRPDLVQTTPDGYRIQLAGHEVVDQCHGSAVASLHRPHRLGARMVLGWCSDVEHRAGLPPPLRHAGARAAAAAGGTARAHHLDQRIRGTVRADRLAHNGTPDRVTAG